MSFIKKNLFSCFFEMSAFGVELMTVSLKLGKGSPYLIETSPLTSRANKLTGFYMIVTSVMKELKYVKPKKHGIYINTLIAKNKYLVKFPSSLPVPYTILNFIFFLLLFLNFFQLHVKAKKNERAKSHFYF